MTLRIFTALIIFLLVSFELSFDDFHQKGAGIFRVLSGKPGETFSNTGIPHVLKAILKFEFPEVEP